jgi:hypothetical protein
VYSLFDCALCNRHVVRLAEVFTQHF